MISKLESYTIFGQARRGHALDRQPVLTWASAEGPGDVWQVACWHEDDDEWWDEHSFAPLNIQPKLWWPLPLLPEDL